MKIIGPELDWIGMVLSGSERGMMALFSVVGLVAGGERCSSVARDVVAVDEMLLASDDRRG